MKGAELLNSHHTAGRGDFFVFAANGCEMV